MKCVKSLVRYALMLFVIFLTTASISGQQIKLVDTLPQIIIADTISLNGYLYNLECKETESGIQLFSTKKYSKPSIGVILQQGGAIYLHPDIFIEFLYDQLDSTEFIQSMDIYEAILPKKPMNIIDVTKSKKHQTVHIEDRFVVGLISTNTYLSSFSHVCNLKDINGYLPVITLYRDDVNSKK